MKYFKTVLLSLLVAASAAKANVEGQFWGQLLSQGKLGGDARLWLEIQPRYSFSTGKITTLLLRPAIGWQLTDTLSLWGGYAWTPSINPTSRDEHRLWFQGILNASPFGLTLAQRGRLEGRFIEGSAATALRLRYLARLGIKLTEDIPVSAIIYDEVFLSLNDASPIVTSGFDQNRLFIGVNYKLSNQFAVDIGYLWNAIRRPGTQPPRINHVLMATLYHHFTVGGD